MKNISNLINTNPFRNILFLSIIFSFLFLINGTAQSIRTSSEIEKLLSRLNHGYQGLDRIKQFENNPGQAAKELLNYYQNRTSVKHPVQLKNEKDSVTVRELKWADDALEHIFVGQPAYPSHFCGEDIDWNSRPVPDNEWVWQLNRMYFWNAMAKVYSQTGDEKYAKEWCSQLVDWTVKNPNDENHKHAWRSIETGIRGYSWTGLYYRFLHSPSFTPEVLVAFLNSMFEHADFLMSKYTTRSNWGLMEAEGMAFIAITFPEFIDAEKWRTEAYRRLNNEINLQVYPDGQQRELAMGYHIGCINWFLRTYELAKLNRLENAFPPNYIKTIEKMCEVPMKLCHPDGTNAQFGDSWQGSPGQYNERFLEWAEKFGRDDFLYLATGGKQGKKPDSTAYALPFSGLYSMKSGWDKDAISLVLKCGPDGGGHSQPDNGTFELYAGGRNLMPDAGSYIYSGDPEGRRWFRQTKVHQTLTLNGENSAYSSKLIKWQTGDKLDILVVENKSYENLTHRRSVFFVDKKYFVLVDEATGSATGDVDIHFQLAPGGVAVSNRDLCVTTNFANGWNLFVQTQQQNGIGMAEEEGWVSFEYTKKESRPAIRYRLQKKQNQGKLHFVTLLIPFKNTMADIQIKKCSILKEGINLEISENGKIRELSYRLN